MAALVGGKSQSLQSPRCSLALVERLDSAHPQDGSSLRPTWSDLPVWSCRQCGKVSLSSLAVLIRTLGPGEICAPSSKIRHKLTERHRLSRCETHRPPVPKDCRISHRICAPH